MRDKRLRWYGHVERSVGSWIDRCRTEPEVEGEGKVGRPPKSWNEVLEKDRKVRGVQPAWAKDRDRWRAACRGDPNVNRDPRRACAEAGADLSLNNSACHDFLWMWCAREEHASCP